MSNPQPVTLEKVLTQKSESLPLLWALTNLSELVFFLSNKGNIHDTCPIYTIGYCEIQIIVKELCKQWSAVQS